MLEAIAPTQRMHSLCYNNNDYCSFWSHKTGDSDKRWGDYWSTAATELLFFQAAASLTVVPRFFNDPSPSALLLHAVISNNCLINIHISFFLTARWKKAEAPLNFFKPSASTDASNTWREMPFWGVLTWCLHLKALFNAFLGHFLLYFDSRKRCNPNLSIQPTFCEILSSWLSIASSLLHHLSQTVCASPSGVSRCTPYKKSGTVWRLAGRELRRGGGDALRLPGVMLADRTERVKRTQLAEAVRCRSLFTCTWTPLRMPKQLASLQSAERGCNPPETAAASDLRHQVWCSGETLLMWAQRDSERLQEPYNSNYR